MVGGKVSMMTGATGPITATITACATGATSMIVGAMFIELGMADVVICGAVDFSLVETILGGFATMNGAYRPKDGGAQELPQTASRPFSVNRRGFVVSEGAGAVVITSKAFAKDHGLTPRLEMAGWAMTSDAHHFVAPRLETVTRCIAQSIAHAGLTPREIDAVNAHGTSTRIGDKIEAEALEAVFGRCIPPVSANKSQLGHAMGAASAIEIILAMEGMMHETLLPTINYTPDPDIVLDCVAEGARSQAQEFVLKNAFGFGGCNACIVLRRIE
jgi:3-oxoacyl-[acyl-carrier-protein] synthase II